MVSSQTSNDPLDLATVALELFKTRSSHAGISPQQLAIECFRYAKSFIAVAEEVLTGDLSLVDELTHPLDSACAPNLKKTHPINLMSRMWGDVKQVEAVMALLDADPAAEAYEPYGWGKPEVNQARALFPAVINRLKQSTPGK